MSTAHPDWLALRTVHLTGGCRAFNGLDPTVEFHPLLVDGGSVRVTLREYRALYARLKQLDVAPIGFDFVSNALEAKALVPPNWRPFLPWTRTNVWPCNDEADRWANISHAGWKAKNPLWEIARRVSHQLRVCAWRLRQVSESYRETLHARTAEKDFQLNQRFADGFTWLGYLSLQSFLVDACVLRDYLAEFYASYACPDADLGNKSVTSMSGLKRRVLDKLSTTNQATQSLKDATADGGWLFMLGAYRDLVVHCVPLARAETTLRAFCTELPVGKTARLPAVSLPLPADPSAIAKSRAAGTHVSQLEDELTHFAEASRADAPKTDGLVYAYICLDKLTRLAHELAGYSPLAPEIPTITQADMVGELKIRQA